MTDIQPVLAHAALVLLHARVVIHVFAVGAAQVGELPLAVGTLGDVPVPQSGLPRVQPRLVLVQVIGGAESSPTKFTVHLESVVHGDHPALGLYLVIAACTSRNGIAAGIHGRTKISLTKSREHFWFVAYSIMLMTVLSTLALLKA